MQLQNRVLCRCNKKHKGIWLWKDTLLNQKNVRSKTIKGYIHLCVRVGENKGLHLFISVCLDKETEKRSKRVVNCWARWGVGQWGWKGVGVKALFIHFDC